MPRRSRAGIIAARAICVGIAGALIVRRLNVGTAAESRARGRWALAAVILGRLLIRPLLRFVRPLLGLILPLLIPVLPPILRSILPSLHLRVSKLAARSTALKNALTGRGNDGETKERAEEQDRCGYRRRTQSFRVGIPVHKTFSDLAPIRLRAGASRRVAPGKRPKFEKVNFRSGFR
jgi:hypothetical protein